MMLEPSVSPFRERKGRINVDSCGLVLKIRISLFLDLCSGSPTEAFVFAFPVFLISLYPIMYVICHVPLGRLRRLPSPFARFFVIHTPFFSTRCFAIYLSAPDRPWIVLSLISENIRIFNHIVRQRNCEDKASGINE